MHQSDPWSFLQTHTRARIAQGRVGNSLPTRALLDFQLDHARARDAVHSTLDTDRLLSELQVLHPETHLLRSEAANRQTYLQRPDLGRRLDGQSLKDLTGPSSVSEANTQVSNVAGFTVAIVMADGLSATAVNRHAIPVVTGLLSEIKRIGWLLAPVCLVQQGRVAIGDAIAQALGAEMVVVLIGERPGLTSPDSLGAYLTYNPRPGLTDDARNCVSNIRPEGLPYDFAVQKLMYLLTEMKARRLSGVDLKDEMPTHTLPHTSSPAAIGQSPETQD